MTLVRGLRPAELGSLGQRGRCRECLDDAAVGDDVHQPAAEAEGDGLSGQVLRGLVLLAAEADIAVASDDAAGNFSCWFVGQAEPADRRDDHLELDGSDVGEGSCGASNSATTAGRLIRRFGQMDLVLLVLDRGRAEHSGR
ncbi:hypothetical protein [Streptomyces shenzhenensis]|uniref:hypothetical protein n=1 Tax=Streptomyces shenzhenensis TaxID=943815 RepID=UPI00217E54C8|nr:hypothetical protein [Streptomyces shenzhenensis]